MRDSRGFLARALILLFCQNTLNGSQFGRALEKSVRCLVIHNWQRLSEKLVIETITKTTDLSSVVSSSLANLPLCWNDLLRDLPIKCDSLLSLLYPLVALHNNNNSPSCRSTRPQLLATPLPYGLKVLLSDNNKTGAGAKSRQNFNLAAINLWIKRSLSVAKTLSSAHHQDSSVTEEACFVCWGSHNIAALTFQTTTKWSQFMFLRGS